MRAQAAPGWHEPQLPPHPSGPQTFPSQSFPIDLLYQVSVVGVLLFTGLSIFFYLKDQGKEVFSKLFID